MPSVRAYRRRIGPASREARRHSQRIFISHGTLDDVIHVQEGRTAHDVLSRSGYPAEYHEYDMAHQITHEVIADLSAWLTDTLPPSS